MIYMIFAATDNDVIGDDSDIEWILPADLKRFRKLTMGHSVIMGRKTYEKIGKPLEGRKNIVITSQQGYAAEGITVVHSTEKALEEADGDVFVMGGAQVFKLFEKLANYAYKTQVHVTVEGETKFALDEDLWQEVKREDHESDEENKFGYTFIDYKRVSVQ